MVFVSEMPQVKFSRPLFSCILGTTLLSTVPGVSGAGPSPQATLLTPILDAELIIRGEITSHDLKPNTPTGCPTPATITRAMMNLTHLQPLFINAGLSTRPTVPCLDIYGEPGQDPRVTRALPGTHHLFEKGKILGRLLSQSSDLLVLGECVPGGTTTALCVMRALGYPASVSSSFVNNPVRIKEEIFSAVKRRLEADKIDKPLDIVEYVGDPMMPVALGIAAEYTGRLFLAGGTQMLAIASLIKALGLTMREIVTTVYIRDDPSANFAQISDQIQVPVYYINPDLGSLGHKGLARYCIGEVKEGMGAGGAIFLASLLGHTPEEIKEEILVTASLSA